MRSAAAAAAVLILSATLLLCASAPAAAQPPELTTGQTVYVPAYSHIYHGPRSKPFDLTCTLSVRSTDLNHGLRLLSVEYYNGAGERVKTLLEQPERLAPLATRSFVIHQEDMSGGSGANFLVVWEAEQPVNPPLMESVMISTRSSQGISFTSRGRPILP
jgi:hypothetical protein